MNNLSQVDTRWFQNRLADQRLSQRKLAGMMGIDPSAVTLMFKGKRAMSAAEAATIARVIGVGVDEVLSRAGIASGAVGAGKAPMGRRWVDDQDSHGPAGDDDQEVPVAGESGAGGLLAIPVPLSDGSVASLHLPIGLTKADADRIAAMVQAFARG